MDIKLIYNLSFFFFGLPFPLLSTLHYDRIPLLRPSGWEKHQLVFFCRKPTAIKGK